MSDRVVRDSERAMDLCKKACSSRARPVPAASCAEKQMTKFHHNYFKTMPRTMETAFGPYQRHGLVEQCDPMPVADKIVTVLGVVCLVVIVALIGLGVL